MKKLELLAPAGDMEKLKAAVVYGADAVYLLSLIHILSKMVVGLPRNMDGTLGERAEKSKKFAQEIQQLLSLPVDLWDERLSTVAAEKMLIEADTRRKKRKKVIDKVAATIILQNYLDAQSSGRS